MLRLVAPVKFEKCGLQTHNLVDRILNSNPIHRAPPKLQIVSDINQRSFFSTSIHRECVFETTGRQAGDVAGTRQKKHTKISSMLAKPMCMIWQRLSSHSGAVNSSEESKMRGKSMKERLN